MGRPRAGRLPNGGRRDSQRARVYAWEDREIGPRDPAPLPFAAAQGMVEAIWAEMGLRYPPAVLPLPRQARTRMGDATRLAIRLPETTRAWHILHELAHAMTSTHAGESDQHGPDFMGLYVQLLVRYLRLPLPGLLAGLARAGIAVNPQARPMFVDGDATPASA